MSAPDPRIPDVNHKPLSWFASPYGKKRNGKEPEEQAVDNVIEHLRDIPDDPIEWPVDPIPAPRNRLAELADLLRHLTWGEMDEFSTAINAEPKAIHEWSNKHG